MCVFAGREFAKRCVVPLRVDGVILEKKTANTATIGLISGSQVVRPSELYARGGQEDSGMNSFKVS